MAASVESPSPSHLNKDYKLSINSSPPLFCPSSEKRFWSDLRNRVDTLLDHRRKFEVQDLPSLDLSMPGGGVNSGDGKGKREDCSLLLRGFDSISSSLSQLTSNIDAALQGARDLAKPSLTEALHNDQEKTEYNKEGNMSGERKIVEEGNQRGEKRKIELLDDQEDLASKEEVKHGKLKKAKHLAISMATKAASLARELKSIKFDLCFMQERCTLLEEENRRLREGYGKEMRHEEDDLVRLQLEALLAEKSRLANENATLTRENQCLHQLVEYHQQTSQDLSASYEQVIQGMCLDFDGVSSPPSIAEEANVEDGVYTEVPQTPRSSIYRFPTSGDDYHEEKRPNRPET